MKLKSPYVESVRNLNKTQIPLVKALWSLGEKYLDSNSIPKEKRRFGFHIPPFTSVDHLHLHCFVLPFNDLIREHKYRVSTRDRSRYVKGWGWFIDVSQAIHVLERGGSIRVSPC
ncbi:hypothetical protein FRC20_010022 [Serendipita sp. 405]|nr:hypothetical protein FRC20_010022 [Serendipita sp. 405]